MTRDQTIFSVTQVNNYLKGLLDADLLLSGLSVRGEISNFKTYPSGHSYFSIKDETSAMRCVMFKREAVSLRFHPDNGMKVIAFGRMTAFPRDGQCQLYCSALTPDGAGDLQIAFEQCKEKLAKEGLFDPAHKKPLPKYPVKIAIITSSAGAAVHDMLRILGARYPLAEVLLLPVRVQGTEAAGEIAAALRYAGEHHLADLVIVGRGGGSAEDLWAFNEEVVARAIYDCAIPVISAVGHEPDVTISDFVADLRAATPSNAAELAVPDQTELFAALERKKSQLSGALYRHLARAHSALERCASCRALQHPAHLFEGRRVLLDYHAQRLASGMQASISLERQAFVGLAASLEALSPLRVLSRGYALPLDAQGAVIRSITDVNCGDQISVKLSGGVLHCRVDARRKK